MYAVPLKCTANPRLQQEVISQLDDLNFTQASPQHISDPYAEAHDYIDGNYNVLPPQQHFYDIKTNVILDLKDIIGKQQQKQHDLMMSLTQLYAAKQGKDKDWPYSWTIS